MSDLLPYIDGITRRTIKFETPPFISTRAVAMRATYVLLGHLALAIGVVGIFVPLLPTTPLVLLAAFFYSRGSKRLHRWLTNHPRFGRSILDWQRHGIIRPRAKWISTLLIIATLSYPIVFKDLPLFAKMATALIGICVLTFIHTRRSAVRTHSPSATGKHQAA